MARIFLDTNILIYAFDKRDPFKQEKAHKLVRSMIIQRTGAISTQVLQEFASVAIAKLRHSVEAVIRELIVLESLEVVQVTPKLIRQGLELLKRYQFHFWDAILLAAAEEAQCDQLFSEDFPAGTVYNTVRVINPLV